MNSIRECIRLILNSNQSNRSIARILKVSHTTVSNRRKRLKSLGVIWPNVDEMNDSEIESLLLDKRKVGCNKREIDHASVYQKVQEEDMTYQNSYDDYSHEDPKTAYSYSSFMYKQRKYERKLDLTMRQIHRAGEKVFIDYAGRMVKYQDPGTGEVRKAPIFVAAMGCSNYTFVFAVKSFALEDLIDALNRMFYFFGGIPEIIVPDNPKTMVFKPGKEIVLNPTFLELCKYYGIIAVPARVRKPKDKAKVEVAVLLVSRWILTKLSDRQFFSIAEINQAIQELLWQLNERPFKKLPGCRRSRFEELDKPLLKPLPSKPFEYAEWVSRQKVGSDYHVCVKDHYYSVPYEIVGEMVEARVTKNIVEILFKGKRIASHLRSVVVGGNTTLPAHQPAAHRAYANLTPEKLLDWAKRIGPGTVAAVKYQFDSRPHAVLGLKPCASLQNLAKEYGEERLEASCLRAQKYRSLTVTNIKSVLRQRLDMQVEMDMPQQINLPLHQNVRGGSYYENRSV